MPFIQWNARYSVGIKEVDTQHNKLLGYINDLHDAMKTGQAKDVMGTIIQNLIRYTTTHFSLEEKLLSENNYPAYLAHKKEHDDFVRKVLEFQKSFQTGSTSLSIDMLNFLRDWLLNHIAVSDRKYSSYLNEKGIK
ncbi:MAG: bacteriohemerythrin [Bacteroidota bacterium]|nr:bacteriohemerythrin [Bacteroidota bacterium]MDP4190381.1 bacteriohemerythrin [Bacteroidota bacterium]MDP4195320.1 bacteriohemerythrin [Bacteroidota bacterium]